jgi:DNA-directed RNA polymerase subunit RPC12/RpoP
MPLKKKYAYYYCRDCEIDFLTPFEGKRVNCPKCADSLFVDKSKDIWIDRPFNYKRPWTKEEDEIILTGAKQGYTKKEMLEALDGRTERAIKTRLLRLKNKKVDY